MVMVIVTVAVAITFRVLCYRSKKPWLHCRDDGREVVVGQDHVLSLADYTALGV